MSDGRHFLRQGATARVLDFTAAAGGYKGAGRHPDLEHWVARSADADSDLLLDLPDLRRRSRDLAINSPMALAGITAETSSVVGTGLKPNASVDRDYLGLSDDAADTWEAAAEAEWALFAQSQECDIRRRLSFADQQEMAFRGVLLNGDHLVAMVRVPSRRGSWPFSFALQHIEADRLCNPNRASDTARLIAGVETDPSGAPLAYHVASRHPDALSTQGTVTWSRLPAFAPSGRRVTHHLLRVLREGQTRGIPMLAPVLSVLKQLDRYVDAEVDRAVKSALFLAFVTTQDGDGSAVLGPDAVETRRAYYREKKITLDHSTVVGLFPGDDVRFSDPKAPNAAAESFLATFARLIGAALEIPHEVLMRHFSSSYSAARGALLMAWQHFHARRAWLARVLCQPIYEAVLWDAISAGRLQAPGWAEDPRARRAWSLAEWIGDAPPVIDEQKAVDAAERRITLGISTRKRETAALTGQDYDQVRRQHEKEVRQSPSLAPTPPPTQAPPQPEPPDGEDTETDPPIGRLTAPSAEALDRLDLEPSP